MRPALNWARFARRLAAVFLVAGLTSCTLKPAELSPGSVTSVEVQLDDWANRQKAGKVSTDDAVKIDALLAVLRSAEPTKDHNCGDTGQVTLRRNGGGEVKLGILAGHNGQYYEFRLYQGDKHSINRVKRAPFLDAMKAFGVGELDPGLSDQGR